MFTGIGYLITSLLAILIKLFFLVFIVGLVGGFIVLAKSYVFTPEDIDAFKAPFKKHKEKEQWVYLLLICKANSGVQILLCIFDIKFRRDLNENEFMV